MKKIIILLLTSVIIFACGGGSGKGGGIIDDDDNTTGSTQTPPAGNTGNGSTDNNTGNNTGNGSADNDTDSNTGSGNTGGTGNNTGGTNIDPLNTNANIGGEKYAYRIEIPALNDDDVYTTRCTTVNGKEQITYSISHNLERRHSRWVAFTFDSSNRAIKAERIDNFRADPDFIGAYTLTSKEINGNGYQRGHLVASHDRRYSSEANDQTFYMSNISPMLGKFNTGMWQDLESLINYNSGWGRSSTFADTLYVVKGGTINEGQYKASGTCPTVPEYFFMALLRLKNNSYYGIAFLMPHKTYLAGEVADYACTIDELEEFTGIDFFCNLNDRLENAVESSINKSSWNLK